MLCTYCILTSALERYDFEQYTTRRPLFLRAAIEMCFFRRIFLTHYPIFLHRLTSLIWVWTLVWLLQYYSVKSTKQVSNPPQFYSKRTSSARPNNSHVERIKHLINKSLFLKLSSTSRHPVIDVINLPFSVCCRCPSIIATVMSNEGIRKMPHRVGHREKQAMVMNIFQDG